MVERTGCPAFCMKVFCMGTFWMEAFFIGGIFSGGVLNGRFHESGFCYSRIRKSRLSFFMGWVFVLRWGLVWRAKMRGVGGGRGGRGGGPVAQP